MNAFRAILVLGIAALGCDGSVPSERSSRVPGAGPVFVELGPARATTGEATAVANLAASIRTDRRRLERRLEVATASSLIDALMLRAQFYGTFDDWDECLQVSRRLVEAYPDHPAALLLRASVLNTLHEFEEALELIDAARAHASMEPSTRAAELRAQARHLEATAEMALGAPIDDVVARRRALASAAPTYRHVTSLALALAERGDYDAADAAFRRALDGYRDVSPFPFAWVAFQRGVMWSEQAGRPDLGRVLYGQAVSHLPSYVLANVHLAELDAIDGNVQAAIDRLLPLIGETQDPEPLAVLATLEPSPESAQRYAAEARATYRRLIRRFPAAFAHHAPAMRAR